MNDAEYLYKHDVMRKSNIARSARNRRTHNGKSGGVKLPSDYMTEKEIQSMNGEVKSYPLNKPMKWYEFKSMPGDIQQTYIELLQRKFGVPRDAIANMLGVEYTNFGMYLKRHGITITRGNGDWDRDGFIAWCNGITQVAHEEPKEEPVNPIIPIDEDARPHVVPEKGRLQFDGCAADIMNTISEILGLTKVKIQVSWDVEVSAHDEQE
jgi:hypothetical protein